MVILDVKIRYASVIVILDAKIVKKRYIKENSGIAVFRNLWIFDTVLISEIFLSYIDINCKCMFFSLKVDNSNHTHSFYRKTILFVLASAFLT